MCERLLANPLIESYEVHDAEIGLSARSAWSSFPARATRRTRCGA
jgi:hypothetical protein